MSLENPLYLKAAFEFFINYVTTKGIDTIIGHFNSTPEEMTVEEHAYCVLTESLSEFCNQFGYEFDEHAFQDTLIFTIDQSAQLTNEEYLKRSLENAIEIELSADAWMKWSRIVEDRILSDKHQKLFRAIQLRCLKGDISSIANPSWMQQITIENFLEAELENEVNFSKICTEIQTGLSLECWLHTQELLLELLYNAIDHGKAKQISLLVDSDSISLVDNGSPFDTLTLAKNGSNYGGSWTMRQFTAIYPDIKIQYKREGTNTTCLQFPEKVFNVNRLCEIILIRDQFSSNFEYKLRYPVVTAKYYYIDLEKSKITNGLFCMSFARDIMADLVAFSNSLNAEVYIYIPNDGGFHWNNIAHKLECRIEYDCPEGKIHIIRGG